MGTRLGVVLDGFIAVDNFRIKSEDIKYYFLTHAHSDHYCSLDNKWNSGIIYCSPITAQVLPLVTHRSRSKRCGVNKNFIRTLELNVWHRMDGFSVMLLDANHIFGSVMFVFEGDRIPNGRTLVTGDFRADTQFYQNVFAMSILQEKKIHVVYLDATYINCTQNEFPSREASTAEICELVNELQKNGSNPITFIVPKIGREQLLVDVATKFKCKIWTDNLRYQISEILGLSEYFTTEQTETSIWTCTRQNARSILTYSDARIIDPSMLSFTKNSLKTNERIHLIKYSDHCSPNELRDFLSLLSFSRIVALSAQLSQEQLNQLEQLSLLGTSDAPSETEINEDIFEKLKLISSSVLNRIGLADDYAFRNVFMDENLVNTDSNKHNEVDGKVPEIGLNENNFVPEEMQETEVQVKASSSKESDNVVVKADERSHDSSIREKEGGEELPVINDETTDISDSIVKNICKNIDLERVIANICEEFYVDENIKKNDPLHELLNEMSISKAIEDLGDMSEKYRAAVNNMATEVRDLPYIAEEHVTYDCSQGLPCIDIPQEWLDESEQFDESVEIELD